MDSRTSTLGILLLYFTLLCYQQTLSQNLLDTSTWTIGTGSVSGFTKYGNTNENVREYGLDHVSNQVILWKAVPDGEGAHDGGWFTDFIPISYERTYRFTVWMKKTGSNSGSTYFGTQSYNSGYVDLVNLDGSVNSDPYFWFGDLPILNRWYLLVGFVHENTYNSTVSLGKIYDGVTGEPVISIDDFKFSTSVLNLRHRVRLFNDENPSNRQFFYKPAMYEVNGNEPTINELLSLNSNSKILFTFDNSGNQKQRFYCQSFGCNEPEPPLGREGSDNQNISKEAVYEDNENSRTGFKLFPNPTKDFINLTFDKDLIEDIDTITLYDVNSYLIKKFDVNKNDTELLIDLSSKPSGVYFLHIHFLKENSSVTKRIIKE